jgi:hypothetical protein
MNLLAAAASFGVLVAVFQYGWGLRLLNLGQAGPVESFLPVLMLAVLFGLSMDYEVFLVSRIREEWAATGDNHRAVRTGQATTGHRRDRPRPGRRRPARRLPAAHRPHAPIRPRQLVAARLAGPRPPAPVHRTRHRTTHPAPHPPAT